MLQFSIRDSAPTEAFMTQTPEYGINFDTSLLKEAGREKNTLDKPLRWFRTMVEFNKGHTYNWPEGSQGLPIYS